MDIVKQVGRAFLVGGVLAFAAEVVRCALIAALQIPLGILAGTLYAKRHPDEFPEDR